MHAAPTLSDSSPPGHALREAGLIALLVVAMLAVRLSGPPDLMDNDQERPAAYAMDILKNGNWIVQVDDSGEIMSKPPLSTWLTALLAWPWGQLNRLTLYLPSALAALATALLLWGLGRAWFGRWAGLLGAFAYLMSSVGLKQVALARTDPIFAFAVFGAAVLAWRAWRSGQGWWVFWLAAAAATMTKGPLGIVLALGGLGAALWERRQPDPWRVPPRMWLGLLIPLVLAGGWFWLAIVTAGQPVIDKMIGRELVGHAVKSGHGDLPLMGFYKPTFYFIARMLPWSLPALVGLWRVMRHPAADPAERRLERFLASYFLVGLAIFSIAPHQRADHLWPLLPAAALLAGRELARWFAMRRVEPRRVGLALATMAVGVLALVFFYQRYERIDDLRVQRTLAARHVAADLRERLGEQADHVVHVDSPYTVQFYLGTMSRSDDLGLAAERLAGPEPAYALVHAAGPLRERLGEGSPLHELARWSIDEDWPLVLVGNRPPASAHGQ